MFAAPESYPLGEHHLHYNPSISAAYELKIGFSERHAGDAELRKSSDDDDGYDGLSDGVLSSPSSPRPPRPATVVGEPLNDEGDLLMLYYSGDSTDQEYETFVTTSPRTSCGTAKGSPADATASKKAFDLAAFAQALYDTRLSVIQGDSDDQLLLSEKDEQDWRKLVGPRRCENMVHERLLEMAENDKVELTPLQTSREAEEEISNTAATTVIAAATVISSPAQSCSNLSRSSRFKELFDLDINKLQPNRVIKSEPAVGTDDTAIGCVITKGQRRAKATRSLGLFGSLRQVTNRTRSQSASSIRGLMRSISTGRNSSSSSNSNRNSTFANGTTSLQHHISPAGLATLQHSAATNKLQKRQQQQQQQQRSLSEESTSNNRGIRLLSQLVGRVKQTTSSRRQMKRVNIKDCSNNDDERSRLVRRTIIYVQPDSENFFTTLSQLEKEPVAPKRAYRDDAISRQPLEGVEMLEMSDGSVTWGIIKKEGRRKSFFNPHESKCEINEDEDEDEETEEQIEERVLALVGLRPDFLKDFQPNPPPPMSASALSSPSAPPPIPARSPFRHHHEQQSQEATHIHTTSNRRDRCTTDIYYAPNATLPSLLQMISEQQETLKESPSVEEQLDEVIRSFSSSSDGL